jgi:hypothetical protein
MRFRPANLRLINRRSNLPRLLLALSSKNTKRNWNDKSSPTDSQTLTGSLHIRDLATTEGGIRVGEQLMGVECPVWPFLVNLPA